MVMQKMISSLFNDQFWRFIKHPTAMSLPFRMSCMKSPVLTEASVEVVPPEHVASSEPALIHTLDLEKCRVEDTQFESEFELVAARDCNITAIAGKQENLLGFVSVFFLK